MEHGSKGFAKRRYLNVAEGGEREEDTIPVLEGVGDF